MSTVRIPPTLRAESGGEARVEASGSTVRRAPRRSHRPIPALRGRIFNGDDIAPFVNVYLEGEDVRTLDGLETPVRQDATVILLPAMAGGRA